MKDLVFWELVSYYCESNKESSGRRPESFE
jgi:hypothetical protein